MSQRTTSEDVKLLKFKIVRIESRNEKQGLKAEANDPTNGLCALPSKCGHERERVWRNQGSLMRNKETVTFANGGDGWSGYVVLHSKL